MEIDLKDSSPGKFWTAVVGIVLTVSGGSGFTSYTLSQAATEAVAKRAAEEAVDARYDQIRLQVTANTTSSIEVKNDIKWIRETLARIERDIRRNAADE